VVILLQGKILPLDLAFFLPFFEYFVVLILILHGVTFGRLGKQ
jgi:hypothetical protein